jgi:cysteine desulfurase
MQSLLMDKLRQLPNVKITGAQNIESRLPGHVSFVVSGLEGESLVMRCDLHGLCISSGSACHKGVIEPSHVLRALGLNDDDAKGSIRISLGRFNTEAECEKLTQILSKALSGDSVPTASAQSRC